MTFALRQIRVVVEKKNVGLTLPHTAVPFFLNWTSLYGRCPPWQIFDTETFGCPLHY
jgi:hypothetical protein